MNQPPITEESLAIEQKVLEIVRQLVADLGTERAIRAVALDASLDRELGLGSLERVELLIRVEKAFSIQIPDNLVAQADTPRDIAYAILNGESSRQEIRRHPRHSIQEAHLLPTNANTLEEVLRSYAQAEPDRLHIYLQSDESALSGEEQTITYGQLFEGAKSVANGLLERGLTQGTTVAIMLPTGKDFFFAFFGILLAGGVPVPIYPPYRSDRIEEYARRQAAILRNAG
ncbi:MAG: AMP-binding protein, partial [Nitrospira sp.]|nr:AMP-binding protein [Nitrospira sp.]